MKSRSRRSGSWRQRGWWQRGGHERGAGCGRRRRAWLPGACIICSFVNTGRLGTKQAGYAGLSMVVSVWRSLSVWFLMQSFRRRLVRVVGGGAREGGRGLPRSPPLERLSPRSVSLGLQLARSRGIRKRARGLKKEIFYSKYKQVSRCTSPIKRIRRPAP